MLGLLYFCLQNEFFLKTRVGYATMLRIQSAFSGADVACIAAEEFRDLGLVGTDPEVSSYVPCQIRRLKQHLQKYVGTPRFQQQILLQGEILKDDEEVQPPLTLQLALLPLRSTSEGKELLEAARREDIESLETLLLQPQDPNTVGDSGETALHWVVERGSAKCCHLLIEAGSLVDQLSLPRFFGGVAPLHMACHRGHLEVLQMLLAARADPDQASCDGGRPLSIASSRGHLEVVRLLLDAGAKLEHSGSHSSGHPLLLAAQRGNLEVLRMLIAAGADVNRATNLGYTPLLVATQRGHFEAVRVLIEAAADVNRRTLAGSSPLYQACRDGTLHIAQLLLKAKATIHDTWDTSPFIAACVEGHLDLVKLLLQHWRNQGHDGQLGALAPAVATLEDPQLVEQVLRMMRKRREANDEELVTGTSRLKRSFRRTS